MCDGVITLNGPVTDFNRDMLLQGLLPTNTEQKEKTEIKVEPVSYNFV